jgi:hypothetical protein
MRASKVAGVPTLMIPKRLVSLFVASEEEKENYSKSLKGTDWETIEIVVGVHGIREHLCSSTYMQKVCRRSTFLNAQCRR